MFMATCGKPCPHIFPLNRLEFSIRPPQLRGHMREMAVSFATTTSCCFWYFWLAIFITFLAIRAFHASIRNVLRTPRCERKLPLIGKQVAIGSVLISLSILFLYIIIFGIWWIRLRDNFTQRGIDGGAVKGNEDWRPLPGQPIFAV